jgi:hypothetical protein
VPGGYALASGTSMSSAIVAGTAALVLASGRATTPPAVTARLVATADIPPGAAPRVNAARAVGVEDPDRDRPPMGTDLTGRASRAGVPTGPTPRPRSPHGPRPVRGPPPRPPEPARRPSGHLGAVDVSLRFADGQGSVTLTLPAAFAYLGP